MFTKFPRTVGLTYPVLCLFVLPNLPALGDAISAERPGFSTAPTTLAPGRFQIESGVEYTRDDNGGVESETTTLPFLLLRAGLTERTEVQISWAGYTDQQFDASNDINGTNDASIIFKYRASADDAATAIGLFGAISVPAGDDEFTSDGTDPTLGLAWEHNNGLFGTFTLSSVTDGDDDRITTFSGAAGKGFSLTNKLGAYIEYYGAVRDSGGPTHQFNGGFTFLPNSNLQLDIFIGAGLNDRAPDFFTGAGVAWRL